jgi:hypothetical protein
MSTPSISFLIPAHNEEETIDHALDRLQKIAEPKVEVLGGRLFRTVAELQAAMECYSCERVAEAKKRRGRAWSAAPVATA